MDIVWLGQGGYLLYMGNKKICIDPYLSDSAENHGRFARMKPIPVNPGSLEADWLICTHDHVDHLDPDTVLGLDMQKVGLILGPMSCVTHLKQLGIPESLCRIFGRGAHLEKDGIRMDAVFADHTKDSIGVVITYADVTVYLTGDTLWNEKLLEIKQYRPDILICCINGKLGNMDSADAAKLARELDVKIAVPSHYGMFMENTEKPEMFRKALESGIRYLELPFHEKVSLIE